MNNLKTPKNNLNSKIIIGIDAGTTRVGFAILKIKNNSKPKLIEYGLMPIKSNNLTQKIREIYNFTKSLLKKYKPHNVIIERMYYYLNKKTSFEVTQAIGVINLACSQSKTPILFINPSQVKKIITSKGNANKNEIQQKVLSIFKIKDKPIDDITDAIAIALSYTKLNNNHTKSVE